MTDAEAHAVVPGASVFRQAMAQVASAVHLVTTDGVAGRTGFTATAVASVSDAPPTVLVCIDGASRTLKALERNGVFCISTLGAADSELARVFAGRGGLSGEERFGAGAWATLVTGAPVLQGALVAFDCRLVSIYPVASHRIVIGEVEALGGEGEGPGLVYRQRSFRPV